MTLRQLLEPAYFNMNVTVYCPESKSLKWSDDLIITRDISNCYYLGTVKTFLETKNKLL